MKCQKCEKPATFHITDLTGDELLALHLCPDCAKHYLQAEEPQVEAPVVSGMIQKQLKLEKTAEDLKELDSRECPICGISFYEFRQAGRLGCPHDYVFFGKELEPLLINVHGDSKHVGKHPKRGIRDTESANGVDSPATGNERSCRTRGLRKSHRTARPNSKDRRGRSN